MTLLFLTVFNIALCGLFFCGSGMDTQLVMRPLLDKIEVKTTATAFRKIHFPHVSFDTLKLFNLHLQLNTTQLCTALC